MRIMTVIGTRPEIIRLSLIIKRLDKLCEHILVFTGQNYNPKLSSVFFKELGVREPNVNLNVRCDNFGEQIGLIFTGIEKVLKQYNPDRVLILGDTNSGLSAIVAKRMGIPVYHMEAGNRCYDDRVPEEVNRRVIDQCSDILLPYTENSRKNLLAEGFPNYRIYVIGNPIFEVIQFYQKSIDESDILSRLGVSPKKYFLVTMHRAENVDVPSRLRSLLLAIDKLSKKFSIPGICSIHPRTHSRMKQLGLGAHYAGVHFLEPFGFFDFINLEKNAFCVLSDSGTVQEECCILGTPNVTIRDVTERPETIECGSNILSGVDRIEECVRVVLENRRNWCLPREYLQKNVSEVVVRILMGFYDVFR